MLIQGQHHGRTLLRAGGTAHCMFGTAWRMCCWPRHDRLCGTQTVDAMSSKQPVGGEASMLDAETVPHVVLVSWQLCRAAARAVQVSAASCAAAVICTSWPCTHACHNAE